MMRRSVGRFAASALDIGVYRLVGGHGAPLAPAGVYDRLATSLTASVREKEIAQLGKALVSQQVGDSKAALASLQQWIGKEPAASSTSELSRMAQGLTAQCLAELNHIEASLAKVSGATSADHQIKLSRDADASFKALTLSVANPTWEAQIASTGYLQSASSDLANNNVAHCHAVSSLTSAKSGLASFVAATTARFQQRGTIGLSVEEKVLQRARLRLRAQRLQAAASTKTAAATKGLKDMASYTPGDVESLAAARKVYDVSSALSEADAEALLVVAMLARGGVTGLDVVPLTYELFAPFTATPAAVHAAFVIDSITESHCATHTNLRQLVDNVDRSAFTREHNSRIASVLAKTTSGGADAASVLDAVAAAMGPSVTALCSESVKFTELVKETEREADVLFATPLEAFQCLAGQAESRVELGLAIAEAGSGKLEAAVSRLDAIRTQGTYVDMWRVLLAKGQALRQLGRVKDSEAAFEELHRLKRQAHADIPLMDTNRTRSAF